MEAIKIFENAQFGQIRIVQNESNEPLFCLADVCKALELSAKGVNQRLGDEVISNYPILDNLGRTQQALFVNEDGLYDVILDSRKAEAKKFRKWVTSEVLPSIRKSGGYIAANVDESPEDIMARALRLADETLKRREERIKALESENNRKDVTIQLQVEEIQKAAPKTEYYDKVLQCQGTMTTEQVAKSIGMDAAKLNRKLKDSGLIYKQSGQWMLHAPYDRWKLHSIKVYTFTNSSGIEIARQYTVWTQRGMRLIHALVDSGWNIKMAVKAINGSKTQPAPASPIN